jgi:hypothetical protein
MAQEYVILRGVRMQAGWPERIRVAQLEPTCQVNGVMRERVRYGSESEDWARSAARATTAAS